MNLVIEKPELNLKFEVEINPEIKMFIGRCYLLKTNRRVWGYRFKNEEQVFNEINSQIQKSLDSKRRVVERREEKKAKALETKKSIKVGDYYEHTFSYENTYVDFYVVSSIKGNTINVRKVSKVVVEQKGYGSEYIKPGEAFGEEIKARINGEYLSVPTERGVLRKTAKDQTHYQSWGY